MGVPSSRTPVRVARGTYANLSTTNALAALQEGEICYATDEGKLYVKQGSSLNGISASSQAQPNPSDVTASPAFTGGSGTQADPYVITGGASPFAGGSLTSAQQITIANGTAGDIVLFTDQSVSASGERFNNQDIGTVNSGGNFTFNLKYVDTPNTTTNSTTYNGVIQVGNVYFSWTVVQSALAPLSQATATTISNTGLAVGNTITATAGTAAGGTSPYTYTIRWQRSFNGTSGWFDTGSTGTTYTIVQADAGYYVRAVATASDSTASASGGPLTLDLPSASTAQINVNSLGDVTNVALSEANTAGARYTSKDFNVVTTMNPEGVPTTSKSLKVKFSGTFTDYPSTDNVTSITDTDPADAAVSASSVPEINYAEYTAGNASGQKLSTNGIYTSAYYWLEDTSFMKFPDNSWKAVAWRRGSNNNYAVGLRLYSTDGFFNSPLPTSKPSYDSLDLHDYYPVNSSNSYTLGYNYNSYNGYGQQGKFWGWVRDSNGAVQGSIVQAYGSSGRLFYFPYNGPSSGGYGYEVANSLQQNGVCLLGVKGWVGSHKYQEQLRYQNTSYSNVRWWQNMHTLNPSLSGWQLDQTNSYTDVNADNWLPWSQLDAPSTARAHFCCDSGYSDTSDKYTIIWAVYDNGGYRGWFIATIDNDANPTVISNWTTRYVKLATITSNVITTGGPGGWGHHFHVTPDGKIGVIWDSGNSMYWCYSGDYGVNWSYSVVSLNSQKSNVKQRYINAYFPYYYDGHWFFAGRLNEDSSNQTWDCVYATNNNGSSWNEVAIFDRAGNVGPNFRYSNQEDIQPNSHQALSFLGTNGRLYIGTRMDGSWSGMNVYFIDYKTQLALSGGTNLSNNQIRLGDTVRQGSATGKVIDIDTSNNTISLDNTNATLFSTGSPLQNTVSHSGGTAGTMYGVVGGSGAVSDLQTSDPGFTSMGSNSNMTVTMPATFPTGNTPDVELPSGTTMQVTVQATNSSGSDSLDSNIITPS